MQISIAESDSEIRACHAIVRELREHVSVDELVQHVVDGRESGFRLAFARSDGEIVAAAGFRVGRSLAWGKFVYVDDLVVRESDRGKGFGGALLDWIVEFAKSLDCQQVCLDSGAQRFQTHRFYLKHGMEISSHQFRLRL